MGEHEQAELNLNDDRPREPVLVPAPPIDDRVVALLELTAHQIVSALEERLSTVTDGLSELRAVFDGAQASQIDEGIIQQVLDRLSEVQDRSQDTCTWNVLSWSEFLRSL